MLFSNRYKFLFVHIAKTAGTSIQSALKRLRRRDPLSYPQVLCYNFSKIFRHRIGTKIPRHARAVAAYDVMPREQFEEFFKFTFIRNPWDIQVSAFYHLKREWPDVMSENGCVEFGDYLRWNFNPDRSYHRAVDPLNQNMIDYMINMDGSMLMDYIG
ncbi:MAG: sulfotransferase family protein, partial [Planctomycetes bacterium]|nr:sulfotransferase family protein [Planctomycetota bacterium]